jgi:hypothetical protein
MNITKKWGEIFVDKPNQELIKEMRKVADAELENGMERKEVNHLYEVYYYLRTGSYSGAWRKINKMKDNVRMKVPQNVYNELKEVCKEMDITVY